MEKYIGYIYITTNKINNKKYIGKRQKDKFDVNYKGSGKYLRRAISKYGIENFDTNVLEWCNNVESLNLSEIKWIKYYNAQESSMFYNISAGGDWGDISKGMTEKQYKEWGNKISKKLTGKKHTNETKLKMSVSMKGKKRLNKENIIKANTGKNNPMYGRKHSKETIEKMKKNNASSKKVICILNGQKIKFNTVIECINYFKDIDSISRGTVKYLLKTGESFYSKYKRLQSVNGLILKYYNEE